MLLARQEAALQRAKQLSDKLQIPPTDIRVLRITFAEYLDTAARNGGTVAREAGEALEKLFNESIAAPVIRASLLASTMSCYQWAGEFQRVVDILARQSCNLKSKYCLIETDEVLRGRFDPVGSILVFHFSSAVFLGKLSLLPDGCKRTIAHSQQMTNRAHQGALRGFLANIFASFFCPTRFVDIAPHVYETLKVW